MTADVSWWLSRSLAKVQKVCYDRLRYGDAEMHLRDAFVVDCYGDAGLVSADDITGFVRKPIYRRSLVAGFSR